MTSKEAMQDGMVQLYVVGKMAKNVTAFVNAKPATSMNATAETSKKQKEVTFGTPKRVNLTSGTLKRVNVTDGTPKRVNMTSGNPKRINVSAGTLMRPTVNAGADVTVGADVNARADLTVGADVNAGADDIEGSFEDAEAEDPDYYPVQESDTNDDLSDGDLSDDEEYKFARENKARFKNYVPTENHVEFSSALVLRGKGDSDNEVNNASSEYATSDGDVDSDVSSEEGEDVGERRRKKKAAIYDPKSDHKNLKFQSGMVFVDSKECAAAITKWAILNGYNLRNIRTNKKQVERHCDENCNWRLFASFDRKTHCFTIKRVTTAHTCNRKIENRQASYGWIATEYLEKIRRNPNMTAAVLIDDVMDKYCVQITNSKAYRAKGHALKLLRGSVADHYAGLWSYMAELM
ncbi:uncharacterized protein LOC126654056 [Mercurialis annua]|uniref:uncharacterized protein LOC126654056 n=1 Tax=Mercurialis annua TaxID=3986 RepID=UPI0024ACBB52|nr:uncharacterized protein LOC126654056 [Mercurialis annua]